MADIVNALLSLKPNTNWTCGDTYSSLDWRDKEQSKPSEAEIDAEIIRLEKEYLATQYQRDREAEYPSIKECVHAILDDDLTALQAKRAEVKKKFPSPE